MFDRSTVMTHSIDFPSLGIHFDVNTTAFSIGSFSVQWYGIIIAVGFLLAILYGFKMADRMNINKDRLFDCILVGLICGIIGARLYYVIFYPGDKYINNPLDIFNIKEGGLGIYGGIIGGLLGGAITAKIRKIKVPALLDIAAIGYLIGQGIGRWGNFINQEAFGTATTLPWGMESDATKLEVVGAVHPCFLYESILCILGFILLHFFNKYLRRYDGQTFLLYLIWYGTGRFFIEGLRTDSLMLPFFDIRVSQALAAATVLISVILLIVFAKKTSLTGCGSKKVMELNGITYVKPQKVAQEEVAPAAASTIFGEEASTEDETDESAIDAATDGEDSNQPDSDGVESADDEKPQEEKDADNKDSE